MVVDRNPFYFGNEVGGDDFCNRVKELDELKKDSMSGQNVLLYAPRRFGKTSLLKKLKKELDINQEYKFIYMDIFSISSVDEFIQKYFSLIAKSFENDSSKAMELFKNILKIRPNITMTLSPSGDISYGLSFAKKEQMQTLEDVLNLPLVYSKKFNKKVIVVFDEFQEIEQLELEKKLRSVIQSHSREVSYIFCGSKKSVLTQMFSDKSRAFYKGVKHIHINEIALDDWLVFITEKFKKSGKVIDRRHIEEAYKITQGFPYYMQQIMAVVWDKTSKEVSDGVLKEALGLIVEREYDLYSTIWSQLTPNQKSSLKYILQTEGVDMYSNENLSNSPFSASTLKSTLEALIKKDICDKGSNRYYLVDPFMKYWLESLK
ncbi:MAG: AAA family ATPase [Campylobacterales bacterium]